MKPFRQILVPVGLACLFLITYLVTVECFNLHVDCAQNVETLRRIIAEKAIYTKEKANLVVVGSSLTALFPTKYYRNWRINLSIPGGASNLGLEILLRSQIYPKFLVVETNTLFIEADKEFIKDLFQEPFYSIKRYIPIFRSEFEPINVIMSLANQIFIGDQARNNIDTVNPDILQRGLRGYKKSFSQVPTEREFDKILNRLKFMINKFQEEGTKIVFLEMPIHPELINSPREKFIREKLTALYPMAQYPWIIPANQRVFEVTDGLHLLFREGEVVNSMIADRIKLLQRSEMVR